MTQQEEKRTDYGVVKIHKRVIAQIATLAAAEVEGVNRISQPIFTKVISVLSAGKIKRFPARIELRENNEVIIAVSIIVNYGVNIPIIAAAVQENIKKAVEKMTGLYPVDIHIKVKGVEAK